MKHIIILIASFICLPAMSAVWQDSKTLVNYEYDEGSGEATVVRSENVYGDVRILTSFSVGGKDYTVTGIGGEAFWTCTNLTGVSIPESVTAIGGGAFMYCSNLTSLTLPKSLTTIGDMAFYYCSGLTSVTIPENVTSIGSQAFHGCNLTSVTFLAGNGIVGRLAFADCSSLASVNIADIGAWCTMSFSSMPHESGSAHAFDCSNPLEIAGHLYMDGREVEDIVIPDGVTQIGSYAFINCKGLKSVTIPESVTKIGAGAFRSASLVSVTSYIREPMDLDYYAFTPAPEATLFVPAGTKQKYEALFNWANGFAAIVEMGGEQGVEDISRDTKDNGCCYDLQGRRVSVSSVRPKGVYIQGGRKYVK